MDWIENSVIYQINWRSIAAREPQNPFAAMQEKENIVSPFAFVCENLELLHDFGVNLLYFMPVFPSGIIGRKGIGSPYAIRDYYKVSEEYGTEEELRQLIAKAHALDMRVILDITPNHTSCDNVWTESHPEYYVKNDDGSFFYDFDWSDTAKLDYHCAGLREEMKRMMKYWLNICGDDGFDGFRLDMAHMINDLSFWNEAMDFLCNTNPARKLLFLAESYGFETNLDLFSRGINAAYDDNFYKICQYGYALDENGNSVVSLSESGKHNDDFVGLYEAFQSRGIAGAMEDIVSNYEHRLSNVPHRCYLARYTDNHDEGRGLYRFGEGAVKAVMQLSFMLPHTIPFILCGQEFGAVNRPSIHERMGICDKGPRFIDNKEEVGIELQGNMFAPSFGKRQEWFAFYRSLIAMRKNVSELVVGEFAVINVQEKCAENERTVIAFERRMGERIVRCAVNLGAAYRGIGDIQQLKGDILYGELHGDELPPFGAVVVRIA